MPSRDTLPVWLDSLSGDVVELRARAGENKSSLESVGVVPRVAEDIISEVDGAGFGPVFRVYGYDEKGKQLTTRLFTDGEEKRADTVSSSQVPTTMEGALFLMAQSYEGLSSRILTSNEKLVDSLAAPIEALAQLFSSESDRRQEAEAAVMSASEYITQLEGLASQASSTIDALEAGTDGTVDPLKAEAVRILRAFAGQYIPEDEEGAGAPADEAAQE